MNVLKDAFTEGRLTQPEYEDRVGRAYQSRTYGELDQVTADIPARIVPPAFLPGAPPYLPLQAPLPTTNGQAIGSLVCGICAPFTAGLSAIPAIALGHIAKSKIRYTGQQGEGLAVAGLVLGYLTVAGIAAITVLFALFAGGS